MTRILSTSGDFVRLTGVRPQFEGVIDTFNRPDGPLADHRWVDAYDIYPTLFDQCQIINGQVEALPTHAETHSVPYTEPADQTGVWGHWMAAMDIGVSDNFEVGIEFNNTDGFQQNLPLGLVDLESANPLVMGIGPVWDITFPATFFENAFRVSTQPGDCWDVNYYDTDYIPGDESGNSGAPFPGSNNPSQNIPPLGKTRVVMRVVGGQMAYYWNGVKRGDTVPIPDWGIENNTWAGFQIIGFCRKVGQPHLLFIGDNYDHIHPELITKWWWRPATSL